MEFEAVIGLEIHAQISTKTKMFCRCDNDSFGKEPNINTCPVCMGFPGQLPVVNKSAVEKGIMAALALNCSIPEVSKFDRKNYFYPDSPKGFQISQFDEPVSMNGYINIDVDGRKVRVGITRVHLEDDAGKLIHVVNGSLVDFNRAGTPLMEIVSDPDMHTAKEACAYAKEIQKIVRYVGSSEADMEKGMMRFDASVSVRPVGEEKLYQRAEIKNLNSFRSLEAAIDYEIRKQIAERKSGVVMEKPITVGWNDEDGKTFFMREKEESDDYRYFPEPDIPELHAEVSFVEGLKNNLPELADVKKQRYIDVFNLNEDDARILSEDPELARYFESVVLICADYKLAVSFINTILMKHLNEDLISINDQKVTPEMMAELIALVRDGVISNNIAKGEVFEEMYFSGKNPSLIIEEKGLMQVSDTAAIEEICKKIVADNPDPVQDVRDGNEKAIGFLVGMVMKASSGKANPSIVNEILRKLI